MKLFIYINLFLIAACANLNWNSIDEYAKELTKEDIPPKFDKTPVLSKNVKRPSKAPKVFTIRGMKDAIEYLKKFEFLDNKKQKFESKDIEDAIKRFQEEAGLKQTGKLDDKSIKLMNTKRCGNVDDKFRVVTSKRAKRYALYSSKWNKRLLTWRLYNYSPDMPAHEIVGGIEHALKLWAHYGFLRFRRVYSGNADLKLYFGSYFHGDPYPFDGPGGVLAHAFYPQPFYKGHIHFDESENWRVTNPNNINTFHFSIVACHEIGHALGLKHSNVPGAVMYPFYQYKGTYYDLHQDDKNGIYALYGCFSGDNKVVLENGKTVLMHQLEIGDSVLTSDGSFSPVLTMLDKNTREAAEFLVVKTTNGKSIELTAKHLIPIKNGADKEYVYAENLKIGHILFSREKQTEQEETIVSISKVKKMGYYAPLTTTGTIVVNGIEASNYAVVSSHNIAHAAVSPLRWSLQFYHYTVGLKSSTSTPNGIHWYGMASYHYLLPLAKTMGIGISS